MNRVDGYSVYQQTNYNSISKKKAEDTKEKTKAEAALKENGTEKTDTINKLEKTKVELSDKAKALLEELRKKYSNMDFMVANYSSEEEARNILSRGTKEFSVLIDPEMLEKMAADEDYKAKQLGVLEEATGNLQNISDKLEENGDVVKRLGVSIGADGTVTYFAELEKIGEKQRERIDKKREENKEKKEIEEEKNLKTKKQEELKNYAGKKKRTTLKASSAEELLELINNFDWDKVKDEDTRISGARIDFSV